MLFRLVITFFPRSKHLLISRLQSPFAVILQPPKNKVSNGFHCFPICLPWRWLLLGRKAMTNLDSVLESKDITLLTKVHIVKAMVFPVVMYGYELDYKESWAPKNWCFWTVLLEKTLESPLDSKEIKPVNLRGNQPWIFIGRTDAEAEALIMWPPDVKSWLIGKDPDAGKDWRQKEKGMTEDEMVGWHHDSMDMNLGKL